MSFLFLLCVLQVENFPAFIVVDDKNNDFFAEWQV